MRTSIGLLHEEPVCKYHGHSMKRHTVDAPKWISLATGMVHLKRKIWKCRVNGCHFVAIGETQREPMGSGWGRPRRIDMSGIVADTYGKKF